MSSELRSRNVGLLGANGFVGSAILRCLAHSGAALRALCGPDLALPDLDGIDTRTCDLMDSEGLRAGVQGLDVVIHAAGPPSVRESFDKPEEYARVHVQGTAALLHACRVANVPQVVYLSSAEVYGRPITNPVSETHALQARSPYAAAKIAAEKMIEAYVESFGLTAVVLRPFSIYGPNPKPDSLFGTILAMAREGCIRLHDLRPVRDYCYVDDLALAVLQACSLTKGRLRTINIGTGKGTSVAEFAACVLQSMNLNIPITEDRSRARPGQSEIFELVADTTMAQEILGWHPKTALSDGLRLALALSSRSV
jgi:nucleoside-diphosphate-sugar epimerase